MGHKRALLQGAALTPLKKVEPDQIIFFSNEENAPLLVVVVVAVSKIQVISKNQTNTNTNMN